MKSVYIGLGSNLDNPKQHVLKAFDDLHHLPKTRLVKRSNLYSSKPMGPQNQPDFINAVASIETSLSPFELLKACQRIENQHDRIRTRRWGPRTLDLDILLYGDDVIETEELKIPHPGVFKREFVLKPLLEISPSIAETLY